MEHLFYPQYRGTYIQVDLGAVAHNVRLLKKETAKDRHMLAVVKANAYGHGIVQVARVALEYFLVLCQVGLKPITFQKQ